MTLLARLSGFLRRWRPSAAPAHSPPGIAAFRPEAARPGPDGETAQDGAAALAAKAETASFPAMPLATGADEEAPSQIHLVAHIANRGDTIAGDDGWAGTPEPPRRIEGFSATHTLPGWSRDISYRAVLAGGSLGPAVPGGAYCGTRGKMQPLFGFQLDAAQGRDDLAAITYEGVFEGGFRSSILSPGQVCASPNLSPLLAMRISALSGAPHQAMPRENIRLVIWDLDETFWGGTLTEGGIVWREETAHIVRVLARRGIVSSICSKNDPSPVLRVLDTHGMRDYFVFPSISWDSKGPRLAALIEAVQLRAPSILFIDDNAMNRAEAEAFVPGLQVKDETAIAGLLDDPRLRGKPDPDMARLAQYRVLERRHGDQKNAAGDTKSFLRDSRIVVTIEHDILPHLDRAIELINRTNQLNFTKSRLAEDPDDPEVARGELRALLGKFNVQAGILHVRDTYGDYGFCGLYVTQRQSGGTPRLLHFAFSCRILGMGIETWLYRLLQRPDLKVAGRVLTDVFADTGEIDWIGTELPGIALAQDSTKPLRYVLARGACDMRALAHYFAMIADRVIEEFDTVRAGESPLLNHSLIATQAIHGIDPRAVADFAPFGFLPEDFNTILAGDVPAGPAVWLFGFSIELAVPLYRHRETGVFLPAVINGLPGHPARMMEGGPIGTADPATIAHLREKFTLLGRRPDERIDTLFRESLHLIFARTPADTRVFVLLANTIMPNRDGSTRIDEPFRNHNTLIAEVARDYPNVDVLDPVSFMSAEEISALTAPHHFDRIVYFRIFRHIVEKLNL